MVAPEKSQIENVTTEGMEMSGITLRIEWKHSRSSAGPPSGRHGPVKCRNLGFGRDGTFFQSFRKFGKWEVPKKILAIQSELFLSGWNRSGVNRWPGGRAIPGNGAHPPRNARVCNIALAGYPIFDLARFGLQGPRICTGQRGTMALVDTSTLVHRERAGGTLRYLD